MDVTPDARIAWPIVGRAVLSAVPLLAVVLAVQVVLLLAADDPADAWAIVLILLLVIAFRRAGTSAAREAPDRPLSHAALAGLGAFMAWVPLRILIAIVGDSERPLGGIFVGLALAVLVSLIGGIGGVRDTRKARD